MTMYKTLVMTILALVGVFCYHKKIVDQEMKGVVIKCKKQ